MNLEISNEERDLLVTLIESRISELHPEIRRSREHEYKDELKQRLGQFEALLERIQFFGDRGNLTRAGRNSPPSARTVIPRPSIEIGVIRPADF